MKSITEIEKTIQEQNPRSAWGKAVKDYALELLEEAPHNVEYGSAQSLEADLLNGAQDWKQYSWGGCSLIYDADIAARVCTPSELKRTRGGELRPNSEEEWLDTQARALHQACHLIKTIALLA